MFYLLIHKMNEYHGIIVGHSKILSEIHGILICLFLGSRDRLLEGRRSTKIKEGIDAQIKGESMLKPTVL